MWTDEGRSYKFGQRLTLFKCDQGYLRAGGPRLGAYLILSKGEMVSES